MHRQAAGSRACYIHGKKRTFCFPERSLLVIVEFTTAPLVLCKLPEATPACPGGLGYVGKSPNLSRHVFANQKQCETIHVEEVFFQG